MAKDGDPLERDPHEGRAPELSVQDLVDYLRVLKKELGLLGLMPAARSVAGAYSDLRRWMAVAPDDGSLSEPLPSGMQKALLRRMRAVRRRVDATRDLGPQSPPVSILESLASAANQLAASVVRFFGSRGRGDSAEGPWQFAARERAFKRSIDKLRHVNHELRQKLDTSQDKAVRAQVKVSAKHFKREAIGQERRSRIAGKCALIFLAVGAAIALLVPVPWGEAPEDWKALRLYAAKGTLLALVLGGALAQSRVYFAMLNGSMLNRQRANALTSFEALYGAANDDHQSVIVQHAAQLIFAPMPTGLSKVPATELSPVGTSVEKALETLAKALAAKGGG